MPVLGVGGNEALIHERDLMVRTRHVRLVTDGYLRIIMCPFTVGIEASISGILIRHILADRIKQDYASNNNKVRRPPESASNETLSIASKAVTPAGTLISPCNYASV